VNRSRDPLNPTAQAAIGLRWPGRLALDGLRAAIDRIDDALLLLVAGRRRLVRVVAPIKRDVGAPPRDPHREAQMRVRAQGLARRLDVPDTTAQQLLGILIGDACRQQGLWSDLDQDIPGIDARMIPSSMIPSSVIPSEMKVLEPTATPGPHRLLRLLPPPKRIAPLLRIIPQRWQVQLLEAAIDRALAAQMKSDALDFMRQRRLAIEVADLRLRWVFELRDGRLRVCDGLPEATVRGSVTDLLLLASRLEDADTLFFQRRLVLTGDTELGLTARNMLDRLPWELVPLGLRIVLNRAARFARVARAAYRGET
jgi:predicted lipid carrier protein YhbT/chorismate mutase